MMQKVLIIGASGYVGRRTRRKQAGMNRTALPTRIDNIIFAGVLALLVFAPLAFGSVHVWAYTIVELGVFLLLGLWFFDRLVVSRDNQLTWVKTPANLFLVLLLAFIGLQLVPLPSAVTALVSPGTLADKQSQLLILGAAAQAPMEPLPWLSLTYYSHATRIEGLKLAAYAGMFFLVVNTLTSRKRIDILVFCLIFLGLFEALYAIYQVFSDAPRVWWWASRVGKARYASGTFIVSNHFAAYMGMLVCLTFGFVIAQHTRSKELQPGLGGFKESIQRLVSRFSPGSGQPRSIMLAFIAVIMGASILLSASRSGIACLGAALLTFAALFSLKKRFRKHAAIALCLCGLTIGLGLGIGMDPTLIKFERSAEGWEKRMITTLSMLPMLADYPAAGVGWGGFRYLYPRYVPAEWDGVSSSGFSHNDWVEAGVEAGLPGLVIIVSAFFIYLFRMIRLWQKRRDLHALGIGAGAVAGMLAIALHSFFDLNMRIPANPLTLAAILGLGYAALHRQGHGASQSFFFRRRKLRLARWARFAVFCLVLAMANTAAFLCISHFTAEAICPSEWNSTMNLNWYPALEDIDRAISVNPGNAEYHFKRARTLMQAKAGNDEEQRRLDDEIRKSLEQALYLNPAQGVWWFQLGNAYAQKREDRYDYLKKWLPLAEDCYDAALKCAPKDAYLLFNIARFWVWRSQLLPKNLLAAPGEDKPRTWEEGVRKFQDLFQGYLALNPDGWKDAFDSVWDTYPQDKIVFGIVPDANDELQSLVLKEIAKRSGVSH